jgi:hypothetical protein
MFRDERMPTHPVHRTQSLLVGGAKAVRPQVVYTQSYTWSSNRKRKQSCTPPGSVHTVLHVVLNQEKETKLHAPMQVVYTVLHVVLKPEKETERLGSFLKATESSVEKKTKLYAPGIVHTVLQVLVEEPEKETERLDGFLKATESSAEKKQSFTPPGSVHTVLHVVLKPEKETERLGSTGRQLPPLSSVLYWPHNYSLEKNQVPRELALIAISLACLLIQ